MEKFLKEGELEHICTDAYRCSLEIYSRLFPKDD